MVYVQRRPGIPLSDAEIRSRLAEGIQDRLLARGFEITPLVDVVVLHPPRRERPEARSDLTSPAAAPP